MNETYLPIKESLGYRNVQIALWDVFHIELGKIDIEEGEYEGFGFTLQYKGYSARISITDTQKNVPFQPGEGGFFSIWFDNPEDSVLGLSFLEEVISDSTVSKKIKRIFGKNEKDIEFALQVLKDYLDKKYEEEHGLD